MGRLFLKGYVGVQMIVGVAIWALFGAVLLVSNVISRAVVSLVIFMRHILSTADGVARVIGVAIWAQLVIVILILTVVEFGIGSIAQPTLVLVVLIGGAGATFLSMVLFYKEHKLMILKLVKLKAFSWCVGFMMYVVLLFSQITANQFVADVTKVNPATLTADRLFGLLIAPLYLLVIVSIVILMIYLYQGLRIVQVTLRNQVPELIHKELPIFVSCLFWVYWVAPGVLFQYTRPEIKNSMISILVFAEYLDNNELCSAVGKGEKIAFVDDTRVSLAQKDKSGKWALYVRSCH